MATKKKIKETAEKAIAKAEEIGLQDNELYKTTLQRYRMQIKILEDLEKAINDSSTLVTKEYVKGRENIYTHPAIKAYNSTAVSANNTALCLLKIVNAESEKKANDENDALMAFIKGA